MSYFVLDDTQSQGQQSSLFDQANYDTFNPSDIKSNETGIHTLLGISKAVSSDHNTFFERHQPEAYEKRFCSRPHFLASLADGDRNKKNKGPSEGDDDNFTSSIDLSTVLEKTEDLKYVQKQLKKQVYERKQQHQIRSRQNFYAAYTRRKYLKQSLNQVLVDFGFTRKTWTQTRKYWHSHKKDKQKFLDFKNYKNRSTFSEEQQQCIKEMVNSHERMSYRKIADKLNVQYPHNKKSFVSVYRQFKPEYRLGYGKAQLFVPYCDKNENIRLKPKMAKQ